MKLVMRLAAIAGLALSVLATTASANVVKVILLGGQSNAVGQGNNSGLPTSPVNLQLPQDDVLFYYTGVGGGLTTLRPGSGGVTMGSEAKFGVEVTFGREIADANPSVTYAIIKHAESGTALYNDWAPGTGPSYTAFRNTVAAGLAALQNAGYTTEIVGMLWHQGESDAFEGQQANYANNLTAFIADIRSRYGANLPFLIGEIRQNGGAYNIVVNAQTAIAAADPFARFVPATDLSFYDFFHFDAAGLITLGERFATAFLDLVSNEPVGDVTIASGFSGSFTAVNSPTDSAYEGDQSATDLLNGLTATVATGWNTGSGSTVAELNDGIHGAFPGGDAEGTWSNEGAVVEYNLGPNAFGYDITSIQSIASWVGAGFGNQVWTVEVKPVGGNYTLLATVDYTPFNNTGGATKVNLTGLDATGIESIRFTAGSTAGNSSENDFVIREIDVEGTATPPASDVTIAPAFSGAFTAVNSPTDSAYEGDQSATDLLNELPATVATGWNLNSGSTVAELNDGIHGAFPGGDAEGTWSNEGAIAEYNLGSNAAGYDITSIQSIASWVGAGFGNQVWTVEVKPVGGSYVLLATVDYTPFNNTGGATKVNLTGLDATGIESIRFTARSTAGNSSGNDFVIREIDVEGTATPTASDVTIASGFSGSFTAVSDSSDSAYEGDQSASDLLNELTATVASVGWTFGGGATLPELNDGIHGAFPGGDAEGTWSNEGAIAEYNLGPNAAGYDITSIQSIASWTDSGFGNQVWTVEVKPVGGSYVLLATVDYTPLNNAGGATKVNLTGLDATGIESIRFTAGSTAGNSVGNNFVIREIDVEGSATPSPSDVTIDPAFSGSFTAVSDPSDSAYEGDQSASDLLNGLTATVATGWNLNSGSTVAELNDGIHGAFPGGDAEGTWSNEGAVAEYNLGPNATGYDITSIQSIASWVGAGFGNQVWTVEVKPVGGSYVLLATVDYTPFNNTGGATKVNLTGLDATGIESIRFTAGSTAGNSSENDFVFREIDVEGVATPPASDVTIASGFSGSFTAVSDPSDSAYEGDQSASDLLNGLTATVATGWNTTNGSTVPELNDGIHGAFPGGDAEGTWSNEGAVAEYNLGPNAAGYDITSIQMIASWVGAGFGNQVWTVEVKPVGGSYVLLATVDYTPFNNTGGATKVNLTGLDATGIESIRFTAGSTAGNSSENDFVIREIDVEGVATQLTVNNAPIANDQYQIANGITPLPITLDALDADGDPLNYSIVSAPMHGTLNGTPPNLTYTNSGVDYNVDGFTFKVNDGVTDSNIATVTIGNRQSSTDTDGDGLLDWQELVAGTNLNDPSSTFKARVSSTETHLNLSWTPVAGKTYDIESCPDLGTKTSWTDYLTGVPYTAGIDVSVSIPIGATERMFYRVRVESINAAAGIWAEPVGVIKSTCSGSAVTTISASLRAKTEYQGSAASIAAGTISTGVTTWSAAQWTTEPHLCYVENASGAEEAYLITTMDETTGVLTLATDHDLTARYPATPTYRICKAVTLGDFFANISAPFETTDRVYLWNGTGWDSYVYFSFWRKVGDISPNRNDTVLMPNLGMYILRGAASELVITHSGAVPMLDQVSTITGKSFISSRFPIGTTLGTSGIHGDANWNANDRIYLWTGSGWDAYFYQDFWRKTTDAVTDANGTVINPESAIFVVRDVAVAAENAGVTQPKPYNP